MAGLESQSLVNEERLNKDHHRTPTQEKHFQCVYLKALVGEVSFHLMIDTVSAYTLLSYQVFQKLPKNKKGNVLPCPPVFRASRTPITTLGQCEVAMQIGHHEVLQQVIVADITEEAVLGVDFMIEHKCCVHLRDHFIQFRGEDLPLDSWSAGTSLSNTGGQRNRSVKCVWQWLCSTLQQVKLCFLGRRL